MPNKSVFSDYESTILLFWRNFLKNEEVHSTDNIFEVGGNSLGVLRFIAFVKRDLDIQISFRDVFLNPTIQELALLIVGQKDSEISDILFSEEGTQVKPLSFSQERLWFIDQFEGSMQYHIPLIYRAASKSLDKNRLEESINCIIERHEALRTVIRQEEGNPFLHVLKDYCFSLNLVEINQDDWVNTTQAIISKPFDLVNDMMIRGYLLHHDQFDLLVVVVHHIAFDGWSVGIFLNELMKLYNAGGKSGMYLLKQNKPLYSDYTQKLHHQFNSKKWDEELAYWKNKLADLTPIDLPIDYPRQPVFETNGAALSFEIDSKTTKKLKEIAQSQNTTLFSTIFTVFVVLLNRYTSQSDFILGIPISNRPAEEFEGLIGMFVNTGVVRAHFKADLPFNELLKKITYALLETYEHQDFPLEKIIETVIKKRDLSRPPLFQVMFSFNNTKATELQLDGQILEPCNLSSSNSQFELTLNVRELRDTLKCSFLYSTNLFSADFIKRLKCHFNQLINSVINNPALPINNLELLSDKEKDILESAFNDNSVNYPKTVSINNLFSKQCKLSPNKTALVSNAKTFTFQQLDLLSNKFANFLINSSVERGMLVPLLLNRDVDLIVAILGILKCGAAYVPIDIAYPKKRINTILKDIEASILITNSQYLHLVDINESSIVVIDDCQETIFKQSYSEINNNCTGDNVAYIIYTSGSTGKPKGVIIKHHQVINYIHGLNEIVNFKNRTIYSLSTISFDIFVIESLLPLCIGGTIILGSEAEQDDPMLAIKKIEECKPDIFNCTPSRLKFLIGAYGTTFLSSFSVLLLGAEPFTVDLFDQIREHFTGDIYNLYGPTETTIYATIKKICNRADINVGKPLRNTRIYILDNYYRPVPIGVYGQICIAGEGVSSGYLGFPKLTQEKFVFKENSDRERMYLTGDIGRWNSSGEIELRGRNDDQLKIRGFRIEPGEIVSAIMASKMVRSAYITSSIDHTKNNYIVCYLISKPEYEQQLLINHLKKCLPQYMIPTVWIEVDEIPLTVNGKVNKKLLPEPKFKDVKEKVVETPDTVTEKIIKNIWDKILETKNISVNDDFFSVGGHSLFAIRIVSEINKTLQISIPVSMVFQLPTIKLLARSIDLLMFNNGVNRYNKQLKF